MELQVEARNLEIRKVWQDKIDGGRIKLMKRRRGLTGIMQALLIICASQLKAHLPIEKGVMNSE
jgi:hypothetical protein